MGHNRTPQAYVAEQPAPADASAPLSVAMRRPLPRPRHPVPQVTFLPFDSFVPSDVDWYQVAMWWRDLYFENNAGYMRAQYLANTWRERSDGWRERSDGWRSLYFNLKANMSPAPAQEVAVTQLAAAYMPARARNRSYPSGHTSGAAPY